MGKKTRKTNPLLISLIQNLKKQAYKHDAPIWKDLAVRLERSSRNWPEVNLDTISKHTHENETALVPGKVLSTGDLTKKVAIAAWSFSEKSREKIKRAGGNYMSIEDLMKKNAQGKNIRILG
jgi:large subunit ribosomal protein L18e